MRQLNLKKLTLLACISLLFVLALSKVTQLLKFPYHDVLETSLQQRQKQQHQQQLQKQQQQQQQSEYVYKRGEVGDCINNGDSDMKKLSRNCGCAPHQPDSDSPAAQIIHPCCRKHLLKLLKVVFKETLSLKLPLVLTGGGLIGWQRNGKLIPYDLDIDAWLEDKYWGTPEYYAMVQRLAAKGFCVWYRSKTWTKIWSSVIGFDIFQSKVRDGRLHYFGLNVAPVGDVYPANVTVLDGAEVLIPRRPVEYLNQLYGKGKWEKPLRCTKVKERKCIE